MKGFFYHSESAVDTFMAIGMRAREIKSDSANILSKIWRVDRENTERTLPISLHHSSRSNDPSSSINYLVNDRILKNDRIDELFHTGALFSAKKVKKLAIIND